MRMADIAGVQMKGIDALQNSLVAQGNLTM